MPSACDHHTPTSAAAVATGLRASNSLLEPCVVPAFMLVLLSYTGGTSQSCTSGNTMHPRACTDQGYLRAGSCAWQLLHTVRHLLRLGQRTLCQLQRMLSALLRRGGFLALWMIRARPDDRNRDTLNEVVDVRRISERDGYQRGAVLSPLRAVAADAAASRRCILQMCHDPAAGRASDHVSYNSSVRWLF